MPVSVLASFPNSRIKPRPATSQRDTSIVEVPDGGVSSVASPNQNRTDIQLRNLDSANSVYYGYENSIDDSVGASGSVELKAGETVSIDVTSEIFVFNNSGAAINIAIDEGEG